MLHHSRCIRLNSHLSGVAGKSLNKCINIYAAAVSGKGRSDLMRSLKTLRFNEGWRRYSLIHKGSGALDERETKNSKKLCYSTAEHSTSRKLFQPRVRGFQKCSDLETSLFTLVLDLGAAWPMGCCSSWQHRARNPAQQKHYPRRRVPSMYDRNSEGSVSCSRVYSFILEGTQDHEGFLSYFLNLHQFVLAIST